MKIYTKTADDGVTGLNRGSRVPKDDLCVEACGTLDELNSMLGTATARLPEGQSATTDPRLLIYHYAELLPPLRSFILPSGSLLSALLHVARPIARRAERRVVSLSRSTEVMPPTIIYLNRLSDLLFTLARLANNAQGVADVPWPPAR